MEQCGFAVNRYTVAQQAPLYEALTWQMNDSIQILETNYAGFSAAFRKSNPAGLYFVGLDCLIWTRSVSWLNGQAVPRRSMQPPAI
jgi:hypothetical protein